MATTTDRLAHLRALTPQMLDELGALTAVESFSADTAACAACARTVAGLGRELLGVDPEIIEAPDGHTHLHWRFGTPRVVLVGHFDTVWPMGTLQRKPFAVSGGRATGPGVFDMKAGIVQGFHALAALPSLDGVTVLFTSDEEIGSLSSRALIEETARGLDAALVLEPSAGGALKVARKGVSMYRVTVHGRAAHAGLEPERGVNALVELAHRVVALGALAAPELGTTVTPTIGHAGTAGNVVPALASLEVDVRALQPDEQRRVDDAVRAMSTSVPGAEVVVEGGSNRPPLPEQASRGLFDRAQAVASRLGLGTLRGVTVGGGSDGNFTAAVGTPTLDGLGAVGDGAHAEHEHVVIDSMAERAALVTGLVEDLLAR
jgi:glutamate carboxypeptidase